MFEKLQVLTMAGAMAKNASARQAVVAQNIAHADTPGYKARQMLPFAETYDAQDASRMRSTRPGHIMPGDLDRGTITTSTTGSSPNGNNVSLETEMVNAVNVKREHDRALTIYKHSMDVLRTSLGRR